MGRDAVVHKNVTNKTSSTPLQLGLVAPQAHEPTIIAGVRLGVVDAVDRDLRMVMGRPLELQRAEALHALTILACGHSQHVAHGNVRALIPRAFRLFIGPLVLRNLARQSKLYGLLY